MITEEQYQQAKERIEEYEKERSSVAIQTLRCIHCNKAMEPVECFLPALDKLEQGAWQGGTVALVRFGYGSRLHDGDAYYVAVCDQCMHEGVEKGIVIHYNTVCLTKG